MFIHHLFYFNPNSSFNVPKLIDMGGTISRTIFMILVGVSISMFKKNKETKSKKPYKTLVGALLVTILSKFCLPSYHNISF